MIKRISEFKKTELKKMLHVSENFNHEGKEYTIEVISTPETLAQTEEVKIHSSVAIFEGNQLKHHEVFDMQLKMNHAEMAIKNIKSDPKKYIQ